MSWDKAEGGSALRKEGRMKTTTLIAAFVVLFVSATIALASGDRPSRTASKLGVRNGVI